MLETLRNFFTVGSYFNSSIRVLIAALSMAYMEGKLPIPPSYDWIAYCTIMMSAWHTGNGNKMDSRIASLMKRKQK